ncbi:CLUMA_CG012838, isoform A [Clunio marinus]|uniref:CLUMA_CG012838, isoform A n=1 Tax=Clunio marinus TaxID=568069 RepID=A0A1J1IGY0_9DIPT|nr:CLUMA_CG012838, isoform A [Clunio marinus]
MIEKIENQVGKPKIPEIKTPGQGGQVLETPKIEVIREQTPDRKSSLAPGNENASQERIINTSVALSPNKILKLFLLMIFS